MLSQKSEVMAKKREVYEEISTTLGIFLTGRDITADDKKRFLEDYSKLWLWASPKLAHKLKDDGPNLFDGLEE